MKKTMSVIIFLSFVFGVTTVSFSADPGFVCQSCNTFYVEVADGDWNVVSIEGKCNHGDVVFHGTKFVFMGSTGKYGPDCTITFSNNNSDKTSQVRFQQDYCYAESGNITVTPIIGMKPQFKITNGSFSGSYGGLVTIQAFQ